MSDTAAQPEAAPAAEGQGAESEQGNELYAEFLDGVPEDLHETLTERLKAKDADFTKKFQSRAEQLKPFEEMGILEQSPEALGQYLQLDQAMQAAQQGDEQAIEAVYQWWDQVGDVLQFYEQGDGDEGEAGGSDEFDPLDMDKDAFDKAVQAKVEEIVGPLQETVMTQQQREQEAAEMEEANQVVEQWKSEVQEKFPDVFKGEDGEAVMDEVMGLATMFTDAENPIMAGLEKYQSLVSKGEAGLFERKLEQPNVPEPGGRADTTPPQIRTMKDAKEAALEYLNNGKQMT
jgi:hypothetical protein